MPVVLILVSISLRVLLINNTAQADTVKVSSVFDSGQVLDVSANLVSQQVFLASHYTVDDFPALTNDTNNSVTVTDTGAIADSGNPSSDDLIGYNIILKYKIQKGDTLPSVATNFKISIETILWANPGLTAKSFKSGKEIIILPVTGVLHQALESETLDSLASSYDVPKYQILNFNKKLIGKDLSVDDQIIIPGGKPLSN